MSVSAENYSFDELLWEREWRKCAPKSWRDADGKWHQRTPDELLAGFTYFCENYWYIRHPSRGRIKFEMFEAQIETVDAWLNNRYVLILKARQIGFSTLISTFTFWSTFFYSDRSIVMLSKTEREAIKLLTKAKYGYKFLPDWMRNGRGPVVNTTQTKIEFSNESVVESLPSASDPARGEAAFLVVVDELAFLQNSEEAWAAIEPVADLGGSVIMMSTANGEGNLFHRLWVEAEQGNNRFHPTVLLVVGERQNAGMVRPEEGRPARTRHGPGVPGQPGRRLLEVGSPGVLHRVPPHRSRPARRSLVAT